MPLVGPPTGSHKYGASYGRLRAINRDFISKVATPRYAGHCVIPNWSSNSMQRDSGESQGRSREEWLGLSRTEIIVCLNGRLGIILNLFVWNNREMLKYVYIEF